VTDQARDLTWDDLVLGREESFSFSFDAEQLEAYARLSGDRNPIHHDLEFARRSGFDAPVVYGGLIVSQVSHLVGMRMPGLHALWTGINLRFRQPLLVGEPAELYARVTRRLIASRIIEITLHVKAGGKTIASGDVQAMVR
jgi:3-hydroxybutyryl-CoA dehydratase